MQTVTVKRRSTTKIRLRNHYTHTCHLFIIFDDTKLNVLCQFVLKDDACEGYFDPDGRLPADQLLVNAQVSSWYGGRRINVGSTNHLGIDLITKAAIKEIYAAANGVVSFSGSQRDEYGNLTGYGNWVEIKHYKADGKLYKTRYAHLKAPSSLKVGDKVSEGDVIGEMGDTGKVTGPHLHFEIFGFNFDLGKWFNINPGNPDSGYVNVGEKTTK